MKHFRNVDDVDNIQDLAALGRALKADPYAYRELGKNKTLGMVFMNASLRTRLSTQKAAINLGMDVFVMNMQGDGYTLETGDGVIMNGNTQEHIKEAAAVIAEYCDVIALRSFPRFESREDDYNEKIMNQFVELTGVPFINMESATVHPLQSLADVITINELKKVERPKVVLTWAPHPRALPQAVSNSFAEWMNRIDVDLVIAHPQGYNLASKFVGDASVTNNQNEALDGADFVYAKNWSSYENYGQILSQDDSWMITEGKMALTNQGRFMHCLPMRRNVIATDGVMDNGASAVVQQAGNRLWSAQAVLKSILESNF